MSKTMRELVVEEFKERHNFRNMAILYDNPELLPDIESMSDEELWMEFQQFINIGPIG